MDFNQVFALVRMPTLMFLSGLLLPKSLAKGTARYLFGKLENIAWPLVVWSAIYVVVLRHPPMDFPNLLAGASYLWFLTFILLFYLAAVPLRPVSGLLIAACAIAGAMWAPEGSKYGERLLFLASFFFLGSWAGVYWRNWLEVVRSRWAPAALFIVVPFAIGAAVEDRAYGPEEWLPALCFVIGGGAVAYRFGDARLIAPLAFVGENSIVFYVLHYPLIFILMRIGALMGVTSPTLLSLAALPTTLIGGYLLAIAAKRHVAVKLLFSATPLAKRLRRKMSDGDGRSPARVEPDIAR